MKTLRSIIAVFLSTGSAYSTSFAADMLFGRLFGLFPDTVWLPIGTWSCLAAFLMFISRRLSGRRKWVVAVPVFLFGAMALLAAVVGSHPHNYLVAGLLFGVAFFCWGLPMPGTYRPPVPELRIGQGGWNMDFTGWTEDQIKRWLWLRAAEWAAFPAYFSQPLAPIMFIFFEWYWVIATVVGLGVLWCLIRYSFINVTFATVACLMVVWFKWPAAIGSAIYLIYFHKPVPGVIALLWPLFAGFIGIPGKIGVIELAFAKKIGFVP